MFDSMIVDLLVIKTRIIQPNAVHIKEYTNILKDWQSDTRPNSYLAPQYLEQISCLNHRQSSLKNNIESKYIMIIMTTKLNSEFHSIFASLPDAI
jgi:hypothetical protein